MESLRRPTPPTLSRQNEQLLIRCGGLGGGDTAKTGIYLPNIVTGTPRHEGKEEITRYFRTKNISNNFLGKLLSRKCRCVCTTIERRVSYLPDQTPPPPPFPPLSRLFHPSSFSLPHTHTLLSFVSPLSPVRFC